MTRSGFNISRSWSPAISPAVTGPGPFLWRRTSATSRVCMRIATAFKFSRMSTTSSCTPSMAVYSCSTPSISISVIAAPGKEDSSTRRSALPRVWPKPRSNGSITMRAWRGDTGCTLTTRGFKNSLIDPCMDFTYVDLTGDIAAISCGALLGIQLDDQALVDVRQNFLPVGNRFQNSRELLVVHFDPVRKTDLGGDGQGSRDARLLLGLLSQADDIARLALVGRDVHQLLVDGYGLVAHQLAGLGARGGEPHAVDHVVQAAFQKLQQRLAGRTGTACGLLIIVSKLTLQNSVHAAQLLLLAQLQPVFRQALLTLALYAARWHLELALRLERLDAALEEQIGSLATRKLALRTGIFCHCEPLLTSKRRA